MVLPLIVLLEIGRTFYHTDALYILSRILLLYFLIFAYSEAKKTKQLKVFIVLVLLSALWALATTIWSYDPIITFPRAFYFAYVAIGAALGGYLWCVHFSKSLLGFLLPANIAIVVISLFSLITNLPVGAWTGGCGIGFMGFAPHQNTLGMMILLTIPSVLFPVFFFLSRRNVVKSNLSRFRFSHSISRSLGEVIRSRITFSLYTFLLLLNFYILILTHSRGSIIAVLLMIVTYLLFSLNWKLLITVGLTLILFITALFLANPQIKIAVTDYVFKTENTIGDRRSTQIDATISAAKHGGLTGLGYGISDPKNIITKDFVEGKRYYREKMISVLALVEEVGVIGLCFFLAIVGYVFWLLFKTFNLHSFSVKGKSQPEAHAPLEHISGGYIQYSTGKWQTSFIISVFVALSFHAQIEGWWPGSGSCPFLIYFVMLGTALGIIKKNSPTLGTSRVN